MSTKKRTWQILFAAAWVAAGVYAAAASAQEQEQKEQKKEAAAAFDKQQAIQAIEKRIAGRENEPASKVFQNIQVLKDVPAGRLLRVMDMGFSNSLGVNCTFCHTPEDWSADSEHKKIARQMFVMTQEINNRLLPAIPEIKDDKPTVNCTTCHRGQKKPALNMGAPQQSGG